MSTLTSTTTVPLKSLRTDEHYVNLINKYVHMNATITTIIEIIVNHVVPPVFFLTLSSTFFEIWVRSRLPADEGFSGCFRDGERGKGDVRCRTSVEASRIPFSSSRDFEKCTALSFS
jgi:hypothetical protein